MANRIRIILECQHERWYPPPRPSDGDTVWCGDCKEYRVVNDSHLTQDVIYPDYNWKSQRDGRRYRGTCLADECGYTYLNNFWIAVRNHMESHHLRAHTNSTLLPTNTERVPVQKLAKGSPPPF